jgi:hypothetical protein
MSLLRNILLITFFVIVSLSIIILAGIRDNQMPEKKVNCRELIGWQPVVANDVLEECKKRSNK